MVTINSSTLRSNVYETIYDTLTSANLLSSTATVRAAYPDEKDASFPMVIVNPVDVSKDNPTFDRTYWSNNISVMIDIFTKKNKDKDLIADEIDYLISRLNIPGISLVGISESNALEPTGGNKIHLKSVILTYKRG